MNSIVISVGGLNATCLSCYGGGTDTPSFDRFASEAFLFDQCYVESTSRTATRKNWWTAQYQHFRTHEPASSRIPQSSLRENLRDSGVRTVLIRDAQFDSADSCELVFERVIHLDRSREPATSRVFDVARRWLEQETTTGDFLLFIDSHGAHPPWFDSASDPADEQRMGAAAVVSRLDAQLGSFLEFLRSGSLWHESLMAVTSDLGTASDGPPEQPKVEPSLRDPPVHVHVPLLLRLPSRHDPSTRSSALVQSIDLMPTVCDAMGARVAPHLDGQSLLPIIRSETQEVRDHALMADVGRQWAIRTPAWLLVLPLSFEGTEAPSESQLFAKPEDRWNRNDMAKQFPDVVAGLERDLRRVVTAGD